ncbi:MAG: hypothetical protein K2P79_03915 [Sphingomonas sp.]|nr:hypothetical protein [Sphingomonas sp.]
MSPSYTSHPSRPLNGLQFGISIIVGIVLWALAALILRVIGPMGALDGTARALSFLVVIPGSIPFVWLMGRLAALRGQALVLGVAAAIMAAAFCDGIALSWVRWIYGDTPAQLAGSGATILWGIGVALAIAFAMARRDIVDR